MKILVFYRSREYSNAIVSSTKAKLTANKNAKGLDVEFINLDKRNYIKVLSQMEELPRYVYIWFDEEKITDYIHENYPSIEVIHFNKDNSVESHWDSWLGRATKDYKLADLIIERFKQNLENRTVYQVDREYKINKKSMNDLDIANSSLIFNTRDEARQYCIDSLKVDISRIEKQISHAQELIKSCKSSLKKKNTLLKKYDKSEDK